ncbi:MAG: hypothetical protein AABX05_02145 [Nanoarchaeota archaeon]
MVIRLLGKLLKLAWLIIGAAILSWIGYVVFKLYTVNSPGGIIFGFFLLLFSLAVLVIYITITIGLKIIKFVVRRK